MYIHVHVNIIMINIHRLFFFLGNVTILIIYRSIIMTRITDNPKAAVATPMVDNDIVGAL